MLHLELTKESRLSSCWTIALVLAILTTLVSSYHLPAAVMAHSGGTDAWGCHAGSRPYHCHTPKRNNNWTSDNWTSNSGSSSYGYQQIDPSICITSTATTLSRADIALVQTLLILKGFEPGPIDGNYGRRTRAALNRFESRNNLAKSRGQYLRNRSLSKLGASC